MRVVKAGVMAALCLCSLFITPLTVASTDTIPQKPLTATTAKTNEEKPQAQEVSRGSTTEYLDMGKFLITAYTAGPESTGKRPGQRGYGITATGTQVQQGRTVSADWRILPPGTRIRIEGLDGIYIVEDSGGAIKGRHLDLYIESLADAKQWGVKRLEVEVVK